jgi:hypothetical protein
MPAPEDHVAVLQETIRERLDALRPLVPDSDGYARAAAAVLEATAELIEYEERLPVLIDEPRHRLTTATVRWAGVVTAAVALLLGICVIPGWVSAWWLALLVPLLLVGLRLVWLPVHPPGGPHPEQRVGALLVGASSPVTVLVVSGLLTPWAAAVTVVLAGLGTAYLLRDPVLPPGAGKPAQASDPDAPTPPSGLVMPP